MIPILSFGNENLSLVSVCSSSHSQACDSQHYSNCKQKLNSSLHITSCLITCYFLSNTQFKGNLIHTLAHSSTWH